MSITTQNEEQH